MQLITRLCEQLVGPGAWSSLGQYRFATRSDFDRVCAALQEHLLHR
ncbi:MAG: hypothetical protein NT062_32075 [Proteobacteria bacterium]|nr:hypothetical protein [Pseudomonadota bacterium]